MSKQTEDRIAALERELAAHKAATPAPTPDTTQAAAQWRDEMHALAERRANNFRFSPQVQREMSRACGDGDLADLVHASHAPRTPTMAGIPSSQTVTGVHPGGGMSGDGQGWKPQRDFGSDGQHPVPGINHVDRVADAFDRRDRAELAERLARQKLMGGHDG